MSENYSFMSDKDCTIIVNSCDRYDDVWLPFFSALKDMWPDCSHKIILNTEHKNFELEGLKITSLNLDMEDGKKPWGWRLRKALALVDTEFVITLFDDFLLQSPVDHVKLKQCILDMKENHDVAVFYFNNVPGPNTPDSRFPGFELIGSRNDYRLNSAPAIWRTKQLLEFTGDIDSPWAWEFFGSARTYGSNKLFYCARNGMENIFIYNYSLGGAIRRGKWVMSVIEPAAQKYGIAIDFDQRGVASESLSDGKYSLRWKIDFFILGFKMIGLKAFIFLYRVLVKKTSSRLKRLFG